MREKNDCLIIGHTSIESYRDLETVISGHQAPTALLLPCCCLPSHCWPVVVVLAFPLLT